MKKKVLFVSRDNTLLKVQKGNHRADSLDRLELMPKVITSLLKIKETLDYELVMVTNQEGLGTAIYPENIFWRIQNKLLQLLENEGVIFDAIFIDRSFETENLPTRKPNVGMLFGYTKELYDFQKSYLVGESMEDMQLAKNLGIQAICFGREGNQGCNRNAASWLEVTDLLSVTENKNYY